MPTLTGSKNGMQLSDKAINDLRVILKEDIGDFEKQLDNDDLTQLGMFFLTVVLESLKIKIAKDGTKTQQD
jgi:hypothetical protein